MAGTAAGERGAAHGIAVLPTGTGIINGDVESRFALVVHARGVGLGVRIGALEGLEERIRNGGELKLAVRGRIAGTGVDERAAVAVVARDRVAAVSHGVAVDGALGRAPAAVSRTGSDIGRGGMDVEGPAVLVTAAAENQLAVPLLDEDAVIVEVRVRRVFLVLIELVDAEVDDLLGGRSGFHPLPGIEFLREEGGAVGVADGLVERIAVEQRTGAVEFEAGQDGQGGAAGRETEVGTGHRGRQVLRAVGHFILDILDAFVPGVARALEGLGRGGEVHHVVADEEDGTVVAHEQEVVVGTGPARGVIPQLELGLAGGIRLENRV